MLDRINGMSEKQRAEAPELFRGVGGEALQSRQFATLWLRRRGQRYATQHSAHGISRGVGGVDNLYLLGGDLVATAVAMRG